MSHLQSPVPRISPSWTKALAVTGLSWLAAAPVTGPERLQAQQPRHETTRVADGLYQFRWETHNTFFVVGRDGVVAFDPISEEAAPAYAAEIRDLAPQKRLRAVVYSHHHADHATGAPVLFDALGQRAPIVAHENAAPKLTGEDPALPPPDLTFRQRATLRLGDRTLELRYLGPSHSDNLIVGYVPEQEVVFAVDFVSRRSVGYRDMSSTHWPDLLGAIERLLEVPFEKAVFGHGPQGDRQSVEEQLSYYRDLREAVRTAIDAGASREEAVEEVELPRYEDWGGYGDWFEMNVDRMYRWLTGEGGDSDR